MRLYDGYVTISGECSGVGMFSIGRQWGQGEGHKKEGLKMTEL